MKKIKLTDFNAEYKEENKITNYRPLNKDKSFTEDGVFSEEIFGDMTDDQNEEIGWIDLEDYYIINPAIFKHLERLIGAKKLNKIISYDKLISREGEIDEENAEDEPDDNIGLKAFKDNFVRVVNEWGNKNKFPDEYKFIMGNMDKVWINKFPVLNSKLRPAVVIANTITFDEINNEYNMILRYLEEILGIKDEYIVMPLLYNIQTFANKVFITIIKDYLMGKRGWLRKNNLGSKINFSARFVITPKINAPIDEVDIPYIGACELYKYQLVSMISASKGINYIEAEKIWRQKSLKYDEEMYKYLMLLKSKSETGLRILLNREIAA